MIIGLPSLKKLETFKWLPFKYLYYDDESVKKFGAYLEDTSKKPVSYWRPWAA